RPENRGSFNLTQEGAPDDRDQHCQSAASAYDRRHGRAQAQPAHTAQPTSGHCQSKFYTACSRPRAGWSSTVFAHELPPRLAGFHAENRLYLFALTVPPALLKQIADLADRKGLSRSAIVEAAVASFLSPDGADRREAAFTRRFDRLTRQVQRLERNVGISTEALALFVRFWLTITPPLPSDAQAAAQIKGRERYEGFIEALGRRLQKGQSLFQEISNDIGENANNEPVDGVAES